MPIDNNNIYRKIVTQNNGDDIKQMSRNNAFTFLSGKLHTKNTLISSDNCLAISVVGPPIIYSGNNFSSSSCIPCGSYCSDIK